MMFSFLETARNRSIENGSKDIVVPDLEKVELISSGGADYNCGAPHFKLCKQFPAYRYGNN